MYFLLACGIVVGSTAPNECRLFHKGFQGLSRGQCVELALQEKQILQRISLADPEQPGE